MIVAVGSDKGAPGATTLATVLGMTWPGERIVCELDPRGADLPYRLLAMGGTYMPAMPSLVNLAVDARPGGQMPRLEQYVQTSTLGVPVIRGEVSTRANARVAPHLPAVARVMADWPGTVIADLGSLQPPNPALVVAKTASIVLLVTRATVEGLGHLRTRIEELSEYVGDPSRERMTVGVVLIAESRAATHAVDQAHQVLSSIGSPVAVVGVLAFDPAGADMLWSGEWSKKLTKSALVQSGNKIADRLHALWPDELTVGAATTQPDARPQPQPWQWQAAEIPGQAPMGARP